MSNAYEPVRECRRMWMERYAEQLSFFAEDIAPWLILPGADGTVASTLTLPADTRKQTEGWAQSQPGESAQPSEGVYA